MSGLIAVARLSKASAQALHLARSPGQGLLAECLIFPTSNPAAAHRVGPTTTARSAALQSSVVSLRMEMRDVLQHRSPLAVYRLAGASRSPDRPPRIAAADQRTLRVLSGSVGAAA